MKKRFLQEIKTSESTMEAFGGYDHRLRIAEGCLFDEQNLTSRHYPVLSTRPTRARLGEIPGLQGFLAKEHLAWVANGQLYYNGQAVEQKEPGDGTDPTACEPFLLSEGEKTMLSMGAKIVIYPDNMSYNTATGEWDHLFVAFDGDATVYPYYDDEIVAAAVQRYDTLPDGKPIEPYTEWDYSEGIETQVGGGWAVASYAPKVGDVVYAGIGDDIKISSPTEDEDTSIVWGENPGAKNHDIFYRYSADGEFVAVPTSKILARITTGSHTQWEQYKAEFEAVEGRFRIFSGLAERVIAGTVVSVTSGRGDGYNADYYVDILLEVSEPFDLRELVDEVWKIEHPRKPILDFVVESGNRLWGCRYGEAMNGERVNEIYASTLGDPAGWNIFENTAADSYVAQLGSDGPFTGAICYSGGIYFFKENGFHRVVGTKPSNYQVSFFNCHGVERGSEKSLILHGDALYYKGVDGIYCYDGSIPYKISDVLGEERYRNAVAGVLGSYIYFEMEDDTGARRIFVYDTARKLWHVEEALDVRHFIPAFGNLVYITDSAIGLMSASSIDEEFTAVFGGIEEEAPFPWFCEFGDFGLSDPDAKYVSKLRLRMTAERGARIQIEVMCDSDGSWKTVSVMTARDKQSLCLPVVTPRCDHFRLRLSGEGGFRLWTLTKEIESTNEVRA